MKHTQRIIRQIGASALEQAGREAEQITREATRRCEEELAACRRELLRQVGGDTQKQLEKIRREGLRERSRKQAELRRSLHARREELCRKVFDAVRGRLLEYAGSEAYRGSLLDRLRALPEGYDHSASTLSLRQEDLPLADSIRAILPGCAVQADKDVKLGGFTLRNEAAGVLLDHTLDERLRAGRPWFLEHCNLRVI